MILFVFEGERKEPELHKTLEHLYFSQKSSSIICSFGNNIYALYKEMMRLDGDGDIVSVLREKLEKRGDDTLADKRSSDFSEIYLFFDYDYQHSFLSLDEINKRVLEMLELFNEETANGKLYINYPMIESIMYTKKLPDYSYNGYTVTRDQCRDFKHLANDFSYYSSMDHILLTNSHSFIAKKISLVRKNWIFLIEMNVRKANFIVSDKDEMVSNINEINQLSIFEGQKRKYVDVNESVAVLNSFPIFLYEYFGDKVLQSDDDTDISASPTSNKK